MLQVLPIQALRVTENRRCLFKRDTVFFVVLQGLSEVPGEHIYVYTLIGACQSMARRRFRRREPRLAATALSMRSREGGPDCTFSIADRNASGLTARALGRMVLVQRLTEQAFDHRLPAYIQASRG